MPAIGPAARRDALATLVLVGAIFGTIIGFAIVPSLRAHPSEVECRALLSHYGEVSVRALGDELSPEERSRAQAMLVAMALSEQNVERCKNLLSTKAAACAAEAATADAVEQCLQ